jgi:hypothetical protein
MDNTLSQPNYNTLVNNPQVSNGVVEPADLRERSAATVAGLQFVLSRCELSGGVHRARAAEPFTAQLRA